MIHVLLMAGESVGLRSLMVYSMIYVLLLCETLGLTSHYNAAPVQQIVNFFDLGFIYFHRVKRDSSQDQGIPRHPAKTALAHFRNNFQSWLKAR